MNFKKSISLLWLFALLVVKIESAPQQQDGGLLNGYEGIFEDDGKRYGVLEPNNKNQENQQDSENHQDSEDDFESLLDLLSENSDESESDQSSDFPSTDAGFSEETETSPSLPLLKDNQEQQQIDGENRHISGGDGYVSGGNNQGVSNLNEGSYDNNADFEQAESKTPDSESKYEDEYKDGFEDEYGVEDYYTDQSGDNYQANSNCTKNPGYFCVPYYQCRQGNIINDGGGLIDIRNGFSKDEKTDLDAQDYHCEGFLDVCCKDPDYTEPEIPFQQYKSRCGRRNRDGIFARIQNVKDTTAQFGEFPHMCALLKIEESDGKEINLYQCGASLIEKGVLLTAAHCIRDRYSRLRVRCGEWDTQSEKELLPHQDRNVTNFVVHPAYNNVTLHNDYAILFVDRDFELTDNVDIVCLPKPTDIFPRATCAVSGWGKDEFGAKGRYQVTLKSLDLPMVPPRTCQRRLRKTRLGAWFRLHPSFVCAGGEEGKDACKGDGGSPLICPSRTPSGGYDYKNYVQTGIVAYGVGCGTLNVPGVYGSVPWGMCFIDHVLSCASGHAESVHQLTYKDCSKKIDALYSVKNPHYSFQEFSHSTKCGPNTIHLYGPKIENNLKPSQSQVQQSSQPQVQKPKY